MSVRFWNEGISRVNKFGSKISIQLAVNEINKLIVGFCLPTANRRTTDYLKTILFSLYSPNSLLNNAL
jgi:glycopeptide antibiotics resistance protein